jgi:hypothetical protein
MANKMSQKIKKLSGYSFLLLSLLVSSFVLGEFSKSSSLEFNTSFSADHTHDVFIDKDSNRSDCEGILFKLPFSFTSRTSVTRSNAFFCKFHALTNHCLFDNDFRLSQTICLNPHESAFLRHISSVVLLL